MKRQFSANLADRPRICSNQIPIRKNPGTFVRIPQKVVGNLFEDTYVRTSVRILEKMTYRFLRNPYKRPRILSNQITTSKNPGTFVRIPQKVVGYFFSCLLGGRGNILEVILAVRTVVGGNISEVFLAVCTVVGENILKVLLAVRTVVGAIILDVR